MSLIIYSKITNCDGCHVLLRNTEININGTKTIS